MRDVKVQFGDFEDLFGQPGHAEGITFVPATVRLHGNFCEISYFLADAIVGPPPSCLIRPLAEQFDAAWVRARIPRVFDYTPGLWDDRKQLFHVTFLAVELQSPFAYPFHCTELAGRSGLIFSQAGPHARLCEKIAKAFWHLLLKDVDNLAEFEAEVIQPESGREVTYGCWNGRPFFDDCSDLDDG